MTNLRYLIENTLQRLLHPATDREAGEAFVFFLVVGIITVCFTLYFIFHLNSEHWDDPGLRRFCWSLSFVLIPFIAPVFYALFYTWLYDQPRHKILPFDDRPDRRPFFPPQKPRDQYSFFLRNNQCKRSFWSRLYDDEDR